MRERKSRNVPRSNCAIRQEGEMREIKFKAWNVATKTMIDLKKITPLALNVDTDGLFIPFSDGLILMQYTGLHDKNGKEIWEQDICKDYMGYLHRVVWDEKYLSYMFERADGKLLSGVGQNAEGFQVEIIGNIYENPDLLNPGDNQK